MVKISFRQSMLAGFLSIALLLSLAAGRSWLTLEQYVEKSRQATAQSLLINAATQELGERTVDLERAMRQYLVLRDKALLDRFDENLALATALVTRLEAMPGAAFGTVPAQWREVTADFARDVHQTLPERELLAYPRLLGELSGRLDQLGRRWIAAQQEAMMAELTQSRLHLAALVGAAVVGAFLVAVFMNWWLTRPIGVLEQVIARLGESRLDEAVVVHGPADLRQVGRRLDWLRVRLRDLEADRERTLRHVSHELKTPLTALREGVDLLKDEIGGPLGATQREIVEILQHNVIALQGHIESLLRLNAVAGEARRLRKRPVRLDALLDHVVQGRALQIQARRLEVRCEAPPLSCLIDDEKLAVAIDNLLSNAIEFSPEGGLIRLEASMEGGYLRIVCADQGAGVDPADAARIFEPFVQGQRLPPFPRQGSGVGLSIVRELMTAMGGTVRLASFADDRDGAVFRMALPCERAPERGA